MDKLSIQHATSSDKKEVISIHGNVYDGRDYITEYFDDFIACPLTTPYIAVIDKKLVGFVATFIVDDGETVVTRAGRMSPSVSGRGLYKQLQAHALKSSGMHRHAFTAVNANPGTKKESFKTINTFILTRPFIRFVFDARSLESLDNPIRSLTQPNHEDFKRFLSTDAVKSYLFPKERIVIDWVPYQTIPENIHLFCWSPQRTKVCSDISACVERNAKGLLTFSTTFSAKSPPYASNIDIYGKDTTTLKDHVISHLRHIRDVTDGVTSLLVFVEPDFDRLELEKVFKDIGLQRNDWSEPDHPDRIYSEQYLYEKYLF